MKSGLKISLKANEKIYINGAVVKVDRKVSLELLNETQFLLESHVLQPEDANTPLRQLYFILQIMLMDPTNAPGALSMFRTTLPLLLETFRDKTILSSLKHVDRLVAEGRLYDALKAIRDLFAVEHEILHPKPAPVPATFTMELRESA